MTEVQTAHGFPARRFVSLLRQLGRTERTVHPYGSTTTLKNRMVGRAVFGRARSPSAPPRMKSYVPYPADHSTTSQRRCMDNLPFRSPYTPRKAFTAPSPANDTFSTGDPSPLAKANTDPVLPHSGQCTPSTVTAAV